LIQFSLCECFVYLPACHQPLVSGGLFDDESKDSELAFRFGVQAINNQRNKQTDGVLEAGEENV
jgi:hypothetical protein